MTSPFIICYLYRGGPRGQIKAQMSRDRCSAADFLNSGFQSAVIAFAAESVRVICDSLVRAYQRQVSRRLCLAS